MIMSRKLHEFLDDENNKDLLNSNEFEELYSQLGCDYMNNSLVSEFTQLLYRANINPLIHMNYIPKYFLYNSNENLKSFEIPNNITSIGAHAFENCRGLKDIVADNMKSNSVKSVGWCAFSNCTSLKSVIIPEGVNAIENKVFNGCTSLTNISIPSSVTRIDYEAFYECGSLVSIRIPNNVEFIGNGAFAYCVKLTDVIIGNNVTIIDRDVFYSCSRLKSINYMGSKLQWDGVHKHRNWHSKSSISVVHCSDGDISL